MKPPLAPSQFWLGDYKCSHCCACDWCPWWGCLLYPSHHRRRFVFSTAGGLHIRYRQQHDAGGGAPTVDGAERGPGVHPHRPVCGAHRRPGAEWWQPGHLQGMDPDMDAFLVALSKKGGLKARLLLFFCRNYIGRNYVCTGRVSIFE